MKVVKLLLIFVLLAGGILLALNWGSLRRQGLREDEGFGKNDLIDIGEKCEEIRMAWDSADGWNENLYQRQRNDIDQSKGMGMFSKEGYNTVNNCLRETATVKACDRYLAVLQDSSFDAKKLKDCYEGVQAVKRYENLEDDARIKEVETRQDLYTKISNFVQSRHVLTPRLDEEEIRWSSFSALQNSVLASARQYRNHALFKEMAHIPGFQDGLNESVLMKMTDSYRQPFYEDLSRQIVRHFEAEDPTDENVGLLKKAYTQFVEEENTYGVRDLASLVLNYKKSEE